MSVWEVCIGIKIHLVVVCGWISGDLNSPWFLEAKNRKNHGEFITKATICCFQNSWWVQLTTDSNTHFDDNPSSMQVKLHSCEAKCNVPLQIYPFLALWYDILDFTLCLSTGLQSSVILLLLVSFFFSRFIAVSYWCTFIWFMLH